jgi:hypothetical protein
MTKHRFYQIRAAVSAGLLPEPFTRSMLRRACPNWPEGTYRAFVSKHRVGNPGRATELFEQVGRGLFRLKSA